MPYFENKVVWITGASSGIGEALAYTFAKQNARLVLSARREEELKRVKAACNLPDDKILVLPLDVSKPELMDPANQQVIERFGQVDILINNAGLSHWSKIKDTDFEVIKTIMNTNFFGAVALTQAVLPGMLQRRQGHIVVIASVLGKIVMPKQSAYIASKHALLGFFDSLRTETATEGVKVLAVCPGFVRTNVAKNSLTRDGKPINKDNDLIANGLDPMYVSQQILNAIQTNREEIIVAGPREKFAVLFKRFAPGLFSKFMSSRKIA